MHRLWRRARAPMLMAATLLASMASAAGPDGEGLSAARARGVLVVGVPYLAPEPAPGAKVRTPERLDAAIARRLAETLGLPVQLRQVRAGEAAGLLRGGEVDLVLADRQEGQPAAAGVAAVPTGYATRPQAVIRSDTAMRRWQDVAGRSVCVAAEADHAQAWAAQWGAQVRTYRAPSDALVAVREGKCDLGVVDDAVWQPLMAFPEWRKFSATLLAQGPRTEHVWLAAQADAAWLSDRMRAWRRDGTWSRLAGQWARDVAFDVYLDQEVPDCHG